MIAPETTDNSSTAVVNGSPVAVTPGLTVASAVVDLTGREITPEGTAADGHPLGIAVAVDDAGRVRGVLRPEDVLAAMEDVRREREAGR